MPLTLLYHDIIDPGRYDASGFPGPGAARYKLRRNHFIDHLNAIVGANYPLPRPDPPLTFDDGGASALDIADLLESHDFRGLFLITTARINTPGFVAPSAIRELHSRGHHIGSHSHTHPPRISACTPTQLRHEWTTSTAILSDLLGQSITAASVPGGFYSRAVADAASYAGITTLYTSEPVTRAATVNGCQVLGRFTLTSDTPASTAARLARGDLTPRLRQYLAWTLRKPFKAVGGGTYLKLRESLLRRAYPHAASATTNARAT